MTLCHSWVNQVAKGFFNDKGAHLSRAIRPCSWAAYVAGALIVLMRELGVRFSDGLSILISSAVPEGKGVSSSAAVEVATMQALAAVHDIKLDGRQLALLCQKVTHRCPTSLLVINWCSGCTWKGHSPLMSLFV